MLLATKFVNVIDFAKKIHYNIIKYSVKVNKYFIMQGGGVYYEKNEYKNIFRITYSPFIVLRCSYHVLYG